MVKRIVAKEKLDCKLLEGQFLDESHYDMVVESDIDCYMPPLCDIATKAECGMDDCNNCDKGNDELRIAFKFRKNYFNKQECEYAYKGLHGAAHQSFNRGIAAGPRDVQLGGDDDVSVKRDWVTPYQNEMLNYLIEQNATLEQGDPIQAIRDKYVNFVPKNKKEEIRGTVWLPTEIQKVYSDYDNWFDRWVDGLSNKSTEEIREQALDVKENWISTTNYAKPVMSGVAGWYDRYPRIPYGRATAYTEQNPELFELAYPFLQSLNKGFKDLLPWRWKNQRSAADKLDPNFLVPGTVFTTITVNKTFRTAAHYDAGDLNTGLSNLLVLGNGEYTGGYLVFPEYRIAVNVRPGDLLLVNNHEVLHGNTPIVLNHKDAERISIVCYFREKMLDLQSYEYESLRRKYIDDRKADPNNPHQRPLWNGISPKMWEEKEWYDYLHKHGMIDPYGKDELANLDSFL